MKRFASYMTNDLSPCHAGGRLGRDGMGGFGHVQGSSLRQKSGPDVSLSRGCVGIAPRERERGCPALAGSAAFSQVMRVRIAQASLPIPGDSHTTPDSSHFRARFRPRGCFLARNRTRTNEMRPLRAESGAVGEGESARPGETLDQVPLRVPEDRYNLDFVPDFSALRDGCPAHMTRAAWQHDKGNMARGQHDKGTGLLSCRPGLSSEKDSHPI